LLKETANIAREAAHTAPPAAYALGTLSGYTFSELSAAAIFIFTVMQIIRAFPKTVRCISCYISHWSCNGTCKELK